VPGQMLGLEELHRKHGAIPWHDLFVDSIAFAKDGMEMKADLRKVRHS